MRIESTRDRPQRETDHLISPRGRITCRGHRSGLRTISTPSRGPPAVGVHGIRHPAALLLSPPPPLLPFEAVVTVATPFPLPPLAPRCMQFAMVRARARRHRARADGRLPSHVRHICGCRLWWACPRFEARAPRRGRRAEGRGPELTKSALKSGRGCVLSGPRMVLVVTGVAGPAYRFRPGRETAGTVQRKLCVDRRWVGKLLDSPRSDAGARRHGQPHPVRQDSRAGKLETKRARKQHHPFS